MHDVLIFLGAFVVFLLVMLIRDRFKRQDELDARSDAPDMADSKAPPPTAPRVKPLTDGGPGPVIK